MLGQAQSIDKNCKFGTIKHTIFEMDKLRLECKELLKNVHHVPNEPSSRNVPSKSFAERKRVARDCVTERGSNLSSEQSVKFRQNYGLFNYNNECSSIKQSHNSIHTAEHDDKNCILPLIKLPMANNTSSERNSAPSYMHPKAVSVVKGQPIFAKRKKAVINCNNPFISHPNECIDIVSDKLSFLSRISDKLHSGKTTPKLEQDIFNEN